MSDSLRPHEPQHARPPCPSPTAGVYPNPCPLSWWCHPTISSSVVPFSSCLQSFRASESFPTRQFKSINFGALSFLYSPTLTSTHDYWKNHTLTRWTFVSKVMSLLFNILSRLVITFLPRSKHLLISWMQSPSAVILEPKVPHCFHCFPIYLPWSDGTGCHDLSFLNVEQSWT